MTTRYRLRLFLTLSTPISDSVLMSLGPELEEFEGYAEDMAQRALTQLNFQKAEVQALSDSARFWTTVTTFTATVTITITRS